MSKILSIIGKEKKNCWKEKWEEKKQNRLVPNWFKLETNFRLIYVTGPEKTGLIYTKMTKSTYSYFDAYLSLCLCYPIFVSCIEFLRILCIYDKICGKMLCCRDEILYLKYSKLGQISRVDKTCFLRPSHI